MDVYCRPEEFGLRLLGTLDEDGLCYEFNMVAVWKHSESGKVYAAQDSGCSCPSPFEDFRSLSDLTELRSESDFNSFVDAHKNHRGESPFPLEDRRRLAAIVAQETRR